MVDEKEQWNIYFAIGTSLRIAIIYSVLVKKFSNSKNTSSTFIIQRETWLIYDYFM